MKKLLALIGVLLIIFIGMYIYKIKINQNTVNVSEVKEIEEYISKIYMWKEITNEALPKFDSINDAPNLWVWEVVKKNLEEYELSYEQIEQKAKEIFGNDFSMVFPKEGSEYMQYDDTTNKYYATGIGLDSEEDSFLLDKIEKTKNGYKVEIVEYLEDYSQSANIQDENEEYDVYVKNLNEETIATIKSTESETKAIEIVKENINSFTRKTINITKNSDGKLYVKSIE